MKAIYCYLDVISVQCGVCEQNVAFYLNICAMTAFLCNTKFYILSLLIVTCIGVGYSIMGIKPMFVYLLQSSNLLEWFLLMHRSQVNLDARRFCQIASFGMVVIAMVLPLFITRRRHLFVSSSRREKQIGRYISLLRVCVIMY